MSCGRSSGLLRAVLNMYSSEDQFLFENKWNFSTGVAKLDFLLDLRNAATPGSSAFAVKPAVQLAAVRPERPDAGAVISAGSDATANGLTHYLETLSAATKFYWRRGFRFKLTAGSYARVEAALSTSYRSCGMVFPASEIVYNPFNDTAVAGYFPVTGPVPTVQVDKGKLVVVGLDNLNNKMEWRAAGRAFSDPKARGSWVDLQAGWNASSVGDFEANTGEIDLSGLSLSSNYLFELALAVRKDLNGSSNSRCIFHVIPALTYV